MGNWDAVKRLNRLRHGPLSVQIDAYAAAIALQGYARHSIQTQVVVIFNRNADGAHSIRQVMKRCLENPGLPDLSSPHSFRVSVVTDLLNLNVPLGDACSEKWVSHGSPWRGPGAAEALLFAVGGPTGSRYQREAEPLAGRPR